LSIDKITVINKTSILKGSVKLWSRELTNRFVCFYLINIGLIFTFFWISIHWFTSLDC